MVKFRNWKVVRECWHILYVALLGFTWWVGLPVISCAGTCVITRIQVIFHCFREEGGANLSTLSADVDYLKDKLTQR